MINYNVCSFWLIWWLWTTIEDTEENVSLFGNDDDTTTDSADEANACSKQWNIVIYTKNRY